MPEVSNRSLAVAALLVAGIGSAAVADRILRRRRQEQVLRPSSDWSEKQVQKWLRSIGVSEGTVSAFRREGIVGSTLKRLSEQDIQMLSVSTKDSELVCGALRKVGETDCIGNFLEQAQGMFAQLATRRVKTKEERLHQLQSVLYAFKSFQMLPADQQTAALLRMSKQVSEACNLAEESGENNGDEELDPSPASSDPGVESGRELGTAENGLPTIVSLMVRLRNLFAAVKEEMNSSESFASRLDRIREMDQELRVIQGEAQEADESDLRSTLLTVSSTVEKLLQQMAEIGEHEKELNRAGDTSMAGGAEGREGRSAEQRNLSATLGTLTAVFQLLKSTEFRNMSSADRAKAASEMLEKVLQSKAEIEAMPGVENERVLRDLVDPLLTILRNLEDVPTAREGDVSEDFLEIRRFLMELANVVNASDLKSEANDAVREQVLQSVNEHLLKVERMLSTLPREERAAGAKMIQTIRASLREAGCPLTNSHSSVAGQQTVGGNSPGDELPKRIMADISGVVKFMQELPPLTLSNSEERNASLRGNLDLLSTTRNDALTLGAPGVPIVAFIDELTDKVYAILMEEQVEEVHDREAEEEDGKIDNEVESFIQTLHHIRQAIPNCKTLADIKPLRDIMERLLTADDQCATHWWKNAAVVKEIAWLKEYIDKFVDEHKYDTTQDAKVEGEGWDNLQVALQAIQQVPPQSLEDLLPYYSVLRGASAQGVGENHEASVENLKSAALSAMRRIYGVRDTTAVGGSQGLIDNLNTMSNTLCDPGAVSEVMIDDFQTTLNEIPTQPLSPKVKEAMGVIQNQIDLARDVLRAEEDNDAEAESDSERTTSEEWESQEEGVKKGSVSDSCAKEAVPITKLQRESEENTQSGTKTRSVERAEDPAVIERDLSLFPRIEAHVSLSPEEFATTCTPFDLNFIRLVLKRLETSSLISDESLRERVREAQKKLAAHLGESGEFPSEEKRGGNPLHVLATETETSSGEKGVKFVICTEAEAVKEKEDCKLKESLAADAHTSEQPSEADRARWDGQSLAILLNDPENTKEERKSVGHELSVLDDALVQNGFTVVDASPCLESREAFEKMLRSALSSKPNRLFVFRSSRKDSDKPDGIHFTDGTTINLGEVMEMTALAERAVLASCHPNRLEMNYRRDADIAPTVAVQLTPDAVAGLRRRRCAIFDGIFTPLVASFLEEERDRTMCPEDLIRSLVSATSSVPCVSGMNGGPAGMMGYFH